MGYGRIEQQKQTPKIATLVKIAAAFDISLSELFQGVGVRPRKRKSAKK